MLRDLIALDDSAKVWVYQADRQISYDELDIIRPKLFEFLDQWTSHNYDLMTYGNVFHQQFLCIFVDESQANASGCGIDKSVHFIESIGAELGVDFFCRTKAFYLQNDEVHSVELSGLPQAYASGSVTDETLFFDPLVKTKHDFLKKWLVPLNKSWLFRFTS